MAPNPLFYQLLLAALVFICLLIHLWWPDDPRHPSTTSRTPDKPRRKRSNDPKPFTGLIHKPLCEACEQGAEVASLSDVGFVKAACIMVKRFGKRAILLLG